MKNVLHCQIQHDRESISKTNAMEIRGDMPMKLSNMVSTVKCNVTKKRFLGISVSQMVEIGFVSNS